MSNLPPWLLRTTNPDESNSNTLEEPKDIWALLDDDDDDDDDDDFSCFYKNHASSQTKAFCGVETTRHEYTNNDDDNTDDDNNEIMIDPSLWIHDKELALLFMRDSNHLSMGKHNKHLLWRRLDPILTLDFDVSLLALETNCCTIAQLPYPQIQMNYEFWKFAIGSNFKWWKELVLAAAAIHDDDDDKHFHNLANDVTLAKCITYFGCEQDVLDVFDHFPQLQSDVDTWLTIIDSNISSLDFIAEYAASESILENKTVMLQACRKNYRVFDILSHPLNTDYDILKVCMSQTPCSLYYIPAFIQQQHLELVALAISASKRQFLDWYEYVAKAAWASRDVALAWATIGGGYLPDKFPPEFQKDAELFLLFAANDWSALSYASLELRSDKQFMMKAVTLNGLIFPIAAGELKRDIELAVQALAHTNNFLSNFKSILLHEYDEDDLNFLLVPVRNHVEQRIQDHLNFEIIWKAAFVDNVYPLNLLNQGQETSRAYKLSIAEYANVLHTTGSGDGLALLRQAQTNLTSLELSIV